MKSVERCNWLRLDPKGIADSSRRSERSADLRKECIEYLILEGSQRICSAILFLASRWDANQTAQFSGGLRFASTTGYFLPSLRDEPQSSLCKASNLLKRFRDARGPRAPQLSARGQTLLDSKFHGHVRAQHSEVDAHVTALATERFAVGEELSLVGSPQ